MTPYLLCYVILALALGLGLLFDKLRIAAIVAFIPMFVLIAGRGIVGTDSAVYVQEFDVIRYQGVFASSFEPGFTILVDALNRVFQDPFEILIFLGSATALIMLCAGLFLERSPLFFMTVIMPHFLIDMTMNGLRYGLAFAIVALGAAMLARGRLKAFVVCCAIATSIQVSSILLAIGLWALIEVRVKTFLGVAIGLGATLMLLGSHLEDKVSQNADISGLGGLSGIAPLFASLAVVVAIRYSNKAAANRLALFAVLAMQVASFVIARYYYAGLRLQNVFLFLLYLLVAIMVRRSAYDLSKDRLVAVTLLATMALSSASRLRNFRDDTNGLSPFNPYYFSSELKV